MTSRHNPTPGQTKAIEALASVDDLDVASVEYGYDQGVVRVHLITQAETVGLGWLAINADGALVSGWQLIDPLCPDCGFYRDTPNHELGCATGRAEASVIIPRVEHARGDEMADGDGQKGRSYFVAKEVLADSLPPGTKVWLRLHDETCDSPDDARALAAEREDSHGEWSPDTLYFAVVRPKIQPVKKKVTFR